MKTMASLFLMLLLTHSGIGVPQSSSAEFAKGPRGN
jgi:hypothetical protein